MFRYFENRKSTYFHVFCLNFSIKTKIKTIFQISYLNLSQKKDMALRVHGFLKTSFSDVSRNLKYRVSNQTSLIWPFDLELESF